MRVLPGANAASEAQVRKRNDYSDLPSTVIFEPVAMETLGGAGRSTASFLKELARRITVLTGEKLAFQFNSLIEFLSIRKLYLMIFLYPFVRFSGICAQVRALDL